MMVRNMIIKYKECININKDFKSSINLLYDLNNYDKIKNFIPTRDLCDVVKNYISCVLGKCEFRSTVLEGPYGKGKSYLMLIICYLLSQRKNKTVLEVLLKKIKAIDVELFNMIIEMEEKKIYLLPVVINNSYYDDLNKNFLISIKNALEMEEITDVVPQSTFKDALEIVNVWKKNEANDSRISECCNNVNIQITLNQLNDMLKKYSIEGYKKFLDLFSCINHGISYKTYATDDIVPVYKDVLSQISKRGYTGIFIVFDEFDSFLENQTSDFSIKLNKIQTLSEVCNNSGLKSQMHFCCVTHKDITLYSKDKNIIDRFKQISGRFKQIRFDRSLDENYELICSAFSKNELYPTLINNYIRDNEEFIKSLYNIGVFYDQRQIDYIVHNGYPFNPITLYALIQVSEKIAQNERTLFTYLSDADESSFRFFINNKTNEDGLLNIDSIYDYFEELIKSNEEYKSFYYKVESLKRSIYENDSENGLDKTIRSILKSIAIIKIINDEVKFNTTIKNIALSLNLSEDIISEKIDILIKKNILKKNFNNDTIDFEIIADSNLNKMISELVETKYANADISELLMKFNDSKYYVSHEYNFNYKMTRFYKCVYIESSKITLLSSLDEFYKEENNKNYCDGLIFDLIDDVKLRESQIRELLNNNSSNIIFRINKKSIDDYVVEKIKMIFSAKELISTKWKLFSNTAVESMQILIEDAKMQVQQYLDNYYNNAKCYCKESNDSNLKNCINTSLMHYYNKTVIFNNEQINKNELSGVTTKARNIVVDSILNDEKLEASSTSQEGTINASFNNAIGKGEIIDLIKRRILESNSNKKSFESLISELKSAPYGIRKGILPLFLAKAFNELAIKSEKSIETIIIYNENTEISLDATNLARIVDNPERYHFNYASINSEKLNMFSSLCQLFNVERVNNFKFDLNGLVNSVRFYVSNLEPIILKSNNRDNILGLNSIEMAFKNLFMKNNINNYEFIFDELPKCLKSDYKDVARNINNAMNGYKRRVCNFYNQMIQETKSLFSLNDGSLKASVELWLSKQNGIDNIIFEDIDKKIYHSLIELPYEPIKAINSISSECVNVALSDFNEQKKKDYFIVLKKFIATVEEKKNSNITKDDFETIEDNVTFSALGNTLYDNLKDDFDSYGEAVSNEEKALILKKMLSDLMR